MSKVPDAVVGKDVSREILLSFWKIHILHHAANGPVVGQWMLEELRRHGYEVSPGTLYPVLKRMTTRGWLRCEFDPRAGSRARRDYYLTARGRAVLQIALTFLAELRGEVMPSAPPRGARRTPGSIDVSGSTQSSETGRPRGARGPHPAR